MIKKKIGGIQNALAKLNSKGELSTELNDKVQQIHGEMYGYLRTYNQIDQRLDYLLREVSELNGDMKTSKH